MSGSRRPRPCNWAFVGEDLLFVDRSSGTPQLVRYHLRDGSATPLPFEVGDVARGKVALAPSSDSHYLILARIAYVLMDEAVRVQNAKISTFGERAEDVFFITDAGNRPLKDPALIEGLGGRIKSAIDAD